MEPLKDLLIFKKERGSGWDNVGLKVLEKRRKKNLCVFTEKKKSFLSLAQKSQSFQSYLHAISLRWVLSCLRLSQALNHFHNKGIRSHKSSTLYFPLMLFTTKRVDDKNHDSTNKFFHINSFGGSMKKEWKYAVQVIHNISCCWKTNNRKTATDFFYCTSLI